MWQWRCFYTIRRREKSTRESPLGTRVVYNTTSLPRRRDNVTGSVSAVIIKNVAWMYVFFGAFLFVLPLMFSICHMLVGSSDVTYPHYFDLWNLRGTETCWRLAWERSYLSTSIARDFRGVWILRYSVIVIAVFCFVFRFNALLLGCLHSLWVYFYVAGYSPLVSVYISECTLVWGDDYRYSRM